MKSTVSLVLALMLFACHDQPGKKIKVPSEKQGQIQAANVSFVFPSTGFAYENRNLLVQECLEAIKSNSTLIKLPQYNDSITVQFLRSREEMWKYTGMTATGIAMVETKTVYIVASGNANEVNPPIRHELMHMMSMRAWGNPGPGSNWMNEGLATFAENNCNGYTVEQVFRYLGEKNMLIPIGNLTTSFYNQPEMIAYHQAAYLVEYLLNKYGVEKFRLLWKEGFAQFETIYGIPFQKELSALKKIAKQHYPAVPAIDWNSFQKGCLLIQD